MAPNRSQPSGAILMSKISQANIDPNPELRSFEPLRAVGRLLLGLVMSIH